MWFQGVEQSPLLTRAWVCQEWTLSCRNLHFSHDQIFWECKTTSCCGSFSQGWPLSANVLTSSATSKRRIWEKMQEIESNTALLSLKHVKYKHYDSEELLAWFDLIQKNISTHITFRTDRLVTMGGIARAWQRDRDFGYFAGLWEHHMLQSLLWQVASKPSRRPGLEQDICEYVAQSWSWAPSIARWHSTKTSEAKNSATKQSSSDSTLKLREKNEFGALKGGSLTIRGRLAETRMVEQSATRSKTRDL